MGSDRVDRDPVTSVEFGIVCREGPHYARVRGCCSQHLVDLSAHAVVAADSASGLQMKPVVGGQLHRFHGVADKVADGLGNRHGMFSSIRRSRTVLVASVVVSQEERLRHIRKAPAVPGFLRYFHGLAYPAHCARTTPTPCHRCPHRGRHDPPAVRGNYDSASLVVVLIRQWLQPSGFTQNVYRAQRIVNGQDVILQSFGAIRSHSPTVSICTDEPSGQSATPCEVWLSRHGSAWTAPRRWPDLLTASTPFDVFPGRFTSSRVVAEPPFRRSQAIYCGFRPGSIPGSSTREGSGQGVFSPWPVSFVGTFWAHPETRSSILSATSSRSSGSRWPY